MHGPSSMSAFGLHPYQVGCLASPSREKMLFLPLNHRNPGGLVEKERTYVDPPRYSFLGSVPLILPQKQVHALPGFQAREELLNEVHGQRGSLLERLCECLCGRGTTRLHWRGALTGPATLALLKSVQVLLNGIEPVMVLTLIVLK